MADVAKTASQLLFQNSLAEVVRKLRSTKRSENEVIEECIAETKKEISSTVQNVKVTAVIKATYFSMLGYSASYGAFNVIEVMADPLFSNKRAGYIAACLTFNADTDVIPLMTALLRRDLKSTNQYEVGLALYCLSCVCTPDLAKDLVSDVVALLNHPRTYVRKKAILCLYRIFIQFPESLRPTYPKLKEKLEDGSDKSDNDPAVRSAVVCVLCELARRNPANFLSLAVPFFALLSTVHNNWTLIKIVKVFGYFAPLEPRLGKKLVDPLMNIIMTTGAKSVQYECILAVSNGMSRVSSLTKLACDKIRLFVEDPDQNLKYLGLDAMIGLIEENPKSLMDQRDTIIACLDDQDTTIRRKALDILRGLVTKKNVVTTVNHMLDHCVRTPPDEEWSNKVIETIVETARTDDYLYIQDFEWYCGILFDLCLVNLSTFQHGGLLEKELVTVMTRVNGVRQYGVEAFSQMLSNAYLLSCDPRRSTQWEVLKAAAFVCGEYPYWLPNKRQTCELLLSDRVALLPPEAQVICVAAVGKIAAYVHHPCARHVELENGEEELDLPHDPVTDEEIRSCALGQSADEPESHHVLEVFRHSVYPDVQERANLVYYQITSNADVGPIFYEADLQPVAAGAQEAVELPDGLDLDVAFCDNIPDLLPVSEADDSDEDGDREDDNDIFNEVAIQQRAEMEKKMAKARMEEVSVFYIKDGSGLSTLKNATAGEDFAPSVPVETIAPGTLDSKDSKKGAKKVFTINRNLSKPSNYEAKTAKHKKASTVEVDEATQRLRGIDVNRALTADERLPEVVPYAKLLEKANTLGETDDSRKTAQADRVPTVVLCEQRYVRVVARIGDCKVKKDAVRLPVLVEVHNLAASNSLHDVSLSLRRMSLHANTSSDAPEVDEGQTLETSWNGVTVRVSGADVGAEDRSVAVSERVKGGSTGQVEIHVSLSGYPDSFLGSAESTTSSDEDAAGGIPLTLTFTKERKPRTIKISLPLKFEYFAKREAPSPPMTSDIFNSKILSTTLKSAPILSAFVPVSQKAMPRLVNLPAINALHLTPIDYFKDCLSCYAAIQTSKANISESHIAVLIAEDTSDGRSGVSIRTKSLNNAAAELLLSQLAEAITDAVSSPHKQI